MLAGAVDTSAKISDDCIYKTLCIIYYNRRYLFQANIPKRRILFFSFFSLYIFPFYWLHLLTHKSYQHRQILQLQYMNQKINISLSYPDLGAIIPSPPMKGLNGSGIITEPSSCWKFSSKQTIILGTAQAVAFNV